jgi:hypothetical protein
MSLVVRRVCVPTLRCLDDTSNGIAIRKMLSLPPNSIMVRSNETLDFIRSIPRAKGGVFQRKCRSSLQYATDSHSMLHRLTNDNIELATTLEELYADREILRSDPEKLIVLWAEMIQMCLWYDRLVSS